MHPHTHAPLYPCIHTHTHTRIHTHIQLANNKLNQLYASIEYLQNDTLKTNYYYDKAGRITKKTRSNAIHTFSYNKDNQLILLLREKNGNMDTVKSLQYKNGKVSIRKLNHFFSNGTCMKQFYHYSYLNNRIIKTESLNPKGDTINTCHHFYSNDGKITLKVFDNDSFVDSIKYTYDTRDSLMGLKSYKDGKLNRVKKWAYLKDQLRYQLFYISNDNWNLNEEIIKNYDTIGNVIEKIYFNRTTVLIEEIRDELEPIRNHVFTLSPSFYSNYLTEQAINICSKFSNDKDKCSALILFLCFSHNNSLKNSTKFNNADNYFDLVDKKKINTNDLDIFNYQPTNEDFYLLAYIAGLKVYLIEGELNLENHKWNAVYINDSLFIVHKYIMKY